MKRSLIALVFLLPLYSQAKDTSQTKKTSKAQKTSQAKETTPQTQDFSQTQVPQQTHKTFYVSGLLGLSNVGQEVSDTEKTCERRGRSPWQCEGGEKEFSFNPEISYGVRLGFLFNDHFSAGIHAQRYSTPSTLEIANYIIFEDLTFTFTNFMAEFNYYLNKAGEDGFWFGGLLGVTQVKLKNPSPEIADKNSNETSFGVSGGYHFMVNSNFSISPQITFIRINRSESVPSFTQLSGLINITFWN